MNIEKTEKATFAGGCFWCMIPPFEKIEGVVSAVAGYAGGKTRNPSYEEVSSGNTGHYEAVQITFYRSRVSYKKLLDVFWMQIDPTDERGQFSDRGSQYRTAIFCHSKKQKKEAEQSKKDIETSGVFNKPIATEIRDFSSFYPAEEYHQDYHRKNPVRYRMYKMISGRERYLKNVWNQQQSF